MLRAICKTGVLALLLTSAIGVGAGTSATPLTRAFPTGPLSPYVLPDVLQRFAVESRVASNFNAPAYFEAFKSGFFGNQLFYTDLLTGVDVIGQAWASRSGATLTAGSYRALLCIFCLPLPGCVPKSESNQSKISRVREALLVGAYGSAKKRTELVNRLTPQFFRVARLEEINLQTVDIEEYMSIKDLLK